LIDLQAASDVNNQEDEKQNFHRASFRSLEDSDGRPFKCFRHEQGWPPTSLGAHQWTPSWSEPSLQMSIASTTCMFAGSWNAKDLISYHRSSDVATILRARRPVLRPRRRSDSEATPSLVRSATRFGALHWSSRVRPQELLSEYERPGAPFQNPFERALHQGLTMEAISLTKTADGDDDLLEIRFGIADPAISKLKVNV
jgi:hypothetical protein